MYLRILMMIIFISPVNCFSVTDSWDAYDYKNCKHWGFQTLFEGRFEAYDKAVKLKDELNLTDTKVWTILKGGLYFERATNVYGVCITYDESTITCHPDSTFPIAGTTFTKGENYIYKCTSGCDKNTIEDLVYHPYEFDSETIDKGSPEGKFETICHEKKKKNEYFEKLYGRRPN